MNLVFGLNCPNCGGRVEVEEGESLAICPYCHAAHKIEGDAGVRKVMYMMEIDESRAVGTVMDWFRHGYKARDLKTKAEITEVYPIYLPFWRLRATGMGIICGWKEETYTDSQGHVHRRRVELEREINQDFDWTEIACDAKEIGVHHLRNLQGRIVPYEEDKIPTFEATESHTSALDRGKKSIESMVYAAANVPNITFSKVFVKPKGFSLIFYPFWIVRYRYKGRGYFATVDGVTSQVVAGRAPGDPMWQALAIAGGSTAGGIIAGLGFLSGSAKALFFTFVVGAAIAYGAYRFFRHGSEIIEGDLPNPAKAGDNNILSSFLKDIPIIGGGI